MYSHPEGLAIARARIAAEKENRTGFLDLGRLGLTEVPGELFELEHLRSLNWGKWWVDEQGNRIEAVSNLGPNRHANLLSVLYRFPALTLLSVSGASVTDLSPLARVNSLRSLDCSHTTVGDLSPLADLKSLHSLNCWGIQVGDLSPLAGLNSLQWLNCSETLVSYLPRELIWLDSLTMLCLSGTRITEVPAEVLSPDPYTNCLESLRAHVRDLEAGEVLLPDVKVLVLGNGRIGKTQISRRLRGEDFQQNADSTHGISVTTALLPMPQRPGAAACLHLWDFGGQDLYHGTHALFMRTRSLFLLVWTPQSEHTREHEYRGVTFRNHRLAYWLEFVRHLSGSESPVVIVQNMCEQPEDEARRSPIEDEALQAFGFHKELHYSALSDRGPGTLDDALQQAVQWQWERMGQVKIGKGRHDVKCKLEALRNEDASLAAGQRKYRTLTRDTSTRSAPRRAESATRHSCSIIFTTRDSSSTGRDSSTIASCSIKAGRCRQSILLHASGRRSAARA